MRTGAAEYWAVGPEVDAVQAFRPGLEARYERAAELSLEAGDVLTPPLVGGWELPLADLFR